MYIINHKLLRSSLFIVLLIALLFAYSRGFIPHDEGWILHPAQRILNGDMPYRDFQYIYTPGAAYLMSFWYMFNGVDVAGARIFTLIFVLMTVFFIYKITKIINRGNLGYILPIAIFVVWAPMHLNFAWPVIFALWSGLASCWYLYLSNKFSSKKMLFIAGIMVGLTILFKQNFGAALLINSILFFSLNSKMINAKNLLIHFAGIALFPIVTIVYFYFNNALGDFYNNMYFFMIDQFLMKGMQSTPYIYPDTWYKMIIKGLAYLSPLIFGIIAAVLAFKKKRQLFHFATFCILFYLFGIRPTTDKMHLVPLLSVIGISILIVYSLVKNKIIKYGLILVQIIYALLGLYSAIFMNYYRWDTPLIEQKYTGQNEKLGVLTDAGYQKSINEITDYILFNTQKNDYVFIYSYSPSLYVLLDRKNPTKYIFMPPNVMSVQVQSEIINDLRKKNVFVVITDHDINYANTKLTEYIKKYYNDIQLSGAFQIWQRKQNQEL